MKIGGKLFFSLTRSKMVFNNHSTLIESDSNKSMKEYFEKSKDNLVKSLR